MVLGGAGQRAVVGELQCRARVRALIGEVVGGVGGHAAEAPRVRAHELGVRVDLDRDGLVGRCRVGQLQPEEGAPVGVGREVRALHLQAAGVGQVVAGVAPAARELRGGPDPLVVDAEPDAVDELQRGRPDAAHLAGAVPAVGVEPAVLEALDVGALAGRDLAAILQTSIGRQLGRRRLGSAGTDKSDSEPSCQSTRDTHRYTSVVGQFPRSHPYPEGPGPTHYDAQQAPLAQLDRARPSGGRGRRFESCRARFPVSPRPALGAPGRPWGEGGPAEAGPRIPFCSYRRVTLRLRMLRTVWTLPLLVLYFATMDTL